MERRKDQPFVVSVAHQDDNLVELLLSTQEPHDIASHAHPVHPDLNIPALQRATQGMSRKGIFDLHDVKARKWLGHGLPCIRCLYSPAPQAWPRRRS
jgi:hypothetical protein